MQGEVLGHGFCKNPTMLCEIDDELLIERTIFDGQPCDLKDGTWGGSEGNVV